jgi:hypothetical protein
MSRRAFPPAAVRRINRPAVAGVVAAAVVLAGGGPVPAAAASAASDPLRAADARGPLGEERLSDERTITRWAHAEAAAAIRAHPQRTARAVAPLRSLTEDGEPEVYVALRAHRDEAGRAWVKVRIPGRPNGRRGWVPRAALGPLHRVGTRLVISRRGLRATLYREGRTVWSSRVGIGAARTPTPRGSFYVREILRVPTADGPYGPWAIGTSAYSVLSDWPGGGVVGLHGTNEPALIPGRPSHGCIRLPNAAVRRLVALLPLGTPVRIL